MSRWSDQAGAWRQRIRSGLRESCGQEIIEFAIASFVFFMTIFGTIEFGRGVWQYNMVSNLAKDGARWASVHGSASPSPATGSAVQTYVRGRAQGMTVTVTTTPAPSTITTGGTVTVVVVNSFTPLVSMIPHGTMTLRSTAQMVMAR